MVQEAENGGNNVDRWVSKWNLKTFIYFFNILNLINNFVTNISKLIIYFYQFIITNFILLTLFF